MVKLQHPLLSSAASGPLGRTLSFGKSKRTHYARARPRVADVVTPKRLSVRAMVRFLGNQWTNINAVNRSTWDEYARSLSISPYNAYLKENLTRWTNYLPPGQHYPVEAEDNASGPWLLIAAAAGTKVTIVVRIVALNDNWGSIIHRSTENGFTPTKDNVVLIVLADEAGFNYSEDTPPGPGTYYYRGLNFSTDGKPRPAYSNQAQATI